jgi:hypothetical protein
VIPTVLMVVFDAEWRNDVKGGPTVEQLDGVTADEAVCAAPLTWKVIVPGIAGSAQ